MSLEYETLHEKDVVVVATRGELVAENTNQLYDHFDELVKQGKCNFVIDMEHLKFLDSSGLASFVKLYKRVQPATGDVRLCCIQPDIQRIFELTRLNKVFTIFNDRRSAIDSFLNSNV